MTQKLCSLVFLYIIQIVHKKRKIVVNLFVLPPGIVLLVSLSYQAVMDTEIYNLQTLIVGLVDNLGYSSPRLAD